MKTNPNHISIMLCLCAVLLSACKKDDEDKALTPEDRYLQEFETEVGAFSDKCLWNMAQRHFITINPRGAHSAKIYTLCCHKFQLVADLSRLHGVTTVAFDAQSYATEFLVDIEGRRYVVKSDGYADASLQPNAPDDVIIDTVPFGWLILVENNYDCISEGYRTADYDFNDMVIRVSSVVTDDNIRMEILPKACGDNQELYLHLNFDGTDEVLWPDNNNGRFDCEFHNWFSIKDYMTRINTGPLYNKYGDEVIYNPQGGWATQDAISKFIHKKEMTLPLTWSMCDFSLCQTSYDGTILSYSGFYVTVGTFKSASYFLKSTEENEKINGDVIAYTLPGKAPRMILIPDEGAYGGWKWTAEENCISLAYSCFIDWVNDNDDPNFNCWNLYEPTLYDYVY